MMILSSKFMNLLNQKLSWLSVNAQTIAQNISHVDTPGMKRKELKSFKELVKRASKKETSIDYRKHIVQTNQEISREDEILKLNENLSMHQLGTNIYKRHMTLVRIIMGKGSGG